MIEFFAFLVSVIAVGISVWSLIRQYNIRGPVIQILNSDVQKVFVSLYKDLPQDIQDKYPNSRENWPGFALIDIVFGNAGDRAGLVNIQRIEVKNDRGLFIALYDSYIVIPAYEIIEREILLRNIPALQGGTPMEIELTIMIEWGGYNAINGKYMATSKKEAIVKVSLWPRPERSSVGLVS